jgi:hypothetical protein
VSRRCSTCGRSFRAEGDWQKLCWTCWRRENPTKSKPPPRAPRERIVIREVPTLTDEKLIRDCVRLTHPDLHPPERFQFANDTTARLLALLERTRRRAA